jgi:hypothetical protein
VDSLPAGVLCLKQFSEHSQCQLTSPVFGCHLPIIIFFNLYINVCLIFIKLSTVTSDLFHKLAANQLLQAEFGQIVYNIIRLLFAGATQI